MIQMSLKIPSSRIGVLIGKEGTVKKHIEDITGTNITIDSSTGQVIILKKPDSGEMIGDWIAKNIVKAIGRGFNPKIAQKLVDEEFLMDIIDLEAATGASQKRVRTIKARLIGESGKTKKNIESLMEVHVSIFGNTVSIIGRYEELKIARDAIVRLINGQSHRTVYRFLQKKRDDLKREQMKQMWKPSSFLD
ncbi:RNA-processing protein [Candidatus Bathyarchaeota archaeon]|nr:RNA-processing protein [Candidatus Bathyarchaeota archaeon]